MDPWVKQLPPALLQKARKELNEIQSEVPDRIEAFREAIEKETTLNARTDDAFLIRFLRARKFDQEKALELLKNYYRQRLRYPQLYAKLSTSALTEVLTSSYIGVLLDRDRHGCPIVVINNYSHWDTSKFALEDVTANVLLSLEKLIEEDEVQINGFVALIDVNMLTVSHFAQATPSALKQFFSVTINAFPARYKEIHFVNEYKIFDAMFLLIKPFLSEKIKSRIFFDGTNYENLHERFDPRILPEEFGGSAGPYVNDEWNKLLAERDEEMKRDLEYGFSSDEN